MYSDTFERVFTETEDPAESMRINTKFRELMRKRNESWWQNGFEACGSVDSSMKCYITIPECLRPWTPTSAK